MRNIAKFHLGQVVMRYLSMIFAQPADISVGESYAVVKESETWFPDVSVDEVVHSLNRDGLYLGINLPEDKVKAIVEFAYAHHCYGNRKPQYGFYYHQKQFAQSYYGQKYIVANYFRSAELCPTIKQLQNDTKLLAIAAKYLEHKPAHQGNQLWWSFAGETTQQEKGKVFQTFHYDLDDFKFLKFFFYLTDVDMLGGPHVCIRGSHKHKKLSYLLKHQEETDEEMINYYGQENLVNICGQAGFGFVENTFCFHKGITPINRDRLILQIEFGTTDYGMQHDLIDTSLLQVIP